MAGAAGGRALQVSSLLLSHPGPDFHSSASPPVLSEAEMSKICHEGF